MDSFCADNNSAVYDGCTLRLIDAVMVARQEKYLAVVKAAAGVPANLETNLDAIILKRLTCCSRYFF